MATEIIEKLGLLVQREQKERQTSYDTEVKSKTEHRNFRIVQLVNKLQGNTIDDKVFEFFYDINAAVMACWDLNKFIDKNSDMIKGGYNMNELAIINYTLDSREVAKMVEKNHNELLKDIRRYIEYLTEGDFPHSDFFQENQYKDRSGKTNPCYAITRKGCEFIANKLTGQKGTLFTATYINRFHEMEQGKNSTPKLPTDKTRRLELQEKNARAKTAALYLRIADNETLPKDYRGIFLSYASKELSGQELLPLPETEQKTYSAGEVGKRFGLSANKIGRLANQYGLKAAEYGKLYHDKSKHSVKEVDSFRYYDTIIPKLEEITGIRAAQ